MRILAVGDSYMPPRYFEQAFAQLEVLHKIEYFQIDAGRPFVPTSVSEQKLKEYEGSLANKLRLTLKNRARAYRPPFRGCCGHPGEPGC